MIDWIGQHLIWFLVAGAIVISAIGGMLTWREWRRREVEASE